MPTPSARPALALASLLLVTGTAHGVVPQLFDPLVPRRLGAPRPWVLASGVAELACAAGLLVPRARPLAAWATAGLFIGVFPGNVQMALDARRRPAAYRAAVYARLPLQVPLVLWAVRVARVARVAEGAGVS